MFEGHAYWLKALIHNNFFFIGIGLAQGLLARVRASPNQGAIQRAQREMVISHQMTKKMIELCAAYMSCVY